MQVILAAILGIKAKWMFFDDLMGQEDGDSGDKVLKTEVNLIEERGTGVLVARAPKGRKPEKTVAQINLLEMEDDSTSSINDYSTLSRPIGKIGVFVQDLFFFRKDAERKKVQGRFSEWMLFYTKEHQVGIKGEKKPPKKQKIARVNLSPNTRFLAENKRKQAHDEFLASSNTGAPYARLEDVLIH